MQLLVHITRSVLCKAVYVFKVCCIQSLDFSTTKKESLNNALSSQKDAKFLIRVAVNITQLREKQQVYLFGQEICTTLHDKETPLAEGSVFDDPCT